MIAKLYCPQMKNAQASLFDNLQCPSEKREQKRRLTHGGEKAKGKRKSRRPIATRKWMHLVLEAEIAKGKLSMLAQNNVKWIDKLLKEKAKKFGIELKDYVNMGNHLHLKTRALNRKGFQNFLRSVTTMIARHVTGARKGKSFAKIHGKFWSQLAFTRIITSFLELTQLQDYFDANRLQKSRGYGARKAFLDKSKDRIQKLRAAKV